MAVSRVFARSRCLLSRSSPSVRLTPTIISSMRSSPSHQNLSTSTRLREDIVQTPSRGPEISLTDARDDAAPLDSDLNARSIALMKLPKQLSRTQIMELLQSKGFNVGRIQMRVSRFTFQGDTMVFAELGSKEEVTQAIRQLGGSALRGKKLVVKPLKADFRWGRIADRGQSPWGSEYFYDEGTGAYEAIRPMIEGRRMMLSVQTPGWTKDVVKNQKLNAWRIIQENFGEYGIEKLGDMSPFYGDIKENPRLLCFIDFKTKEGAERAASDKHDTEIEGRKTWLQLSIPSGWRAHQFLKLDPKLAGELQEQGVLPKELWEDKFGFPLPEKSEKGTG